MDATSSEAVLERQQTAEALRRAIDAAKSIYALADRVGVTYQAVQKWLRAGVVPPRRVLAVEKATRYRVKRWELRPDLYPPPPRIVRARAAAEAAAQANTTAPA